MTDRKTELKRLDRELDRVTYDIYKENDKFYIRKQKIDDLDKTSEENFDKKIEKLIKVFYLDIDNVLHKVYKLNREEYTTVIKKLNSYNNILMYIYKTNEKISKNNKNVEDYIVDINTYIDKFYSINIPAYKRLVKESEKNLLKISPSSR